ncbi:Hypothetical Protein FCC1311_075262 [Hondaea fermentalgiana]|uniref:Uncharacterized protein n=1 Tax=Hondaea fermentalgiana TaxID=2315210 RepID=A0A2R5GRN9_9STRA|nr:Hypothetical Protein FCC1311_075262 [Hondaea fermentalgiana]|eukprot:GBG31303.1 Hypothetical Protein FCC1311_075262 [Hondaea fermentalgiana]
MVSKLIFGLLSAVVLMTVYSVYTGTSRLEAFSQIMVGAPKLYLEREAPVQTSGAAVEALAQDTLKVKPANGKVDSVFPEGDHSNTVRGVDDQEVRVNDADELYGDSNDEISKLRLQPPESANGDQNAAHKGLSREVLQSEILHDLIQEDDELIPIPVDSQDLADHKIPTMLHSYTVTAYMIEVYQRPSFAADKTGRLVHKGDTVVGPRTWKKEYVTWLELAPDAYMPLAVFPNTPQFKKTAALYLKMKSLRAFNERALEPLEDCEVKTTSKEVFTCRRDNFVRKEIARVAEDYDVRDYAPKSLGRTRGDANEQHILRALESLFEANAPFEFPKLEL